MLSKEEKEAIKDIENWLDATEDDETTINLLFQKCSILEDIIEKQQAEIERLKK